MHQQRRSPVLAAGESLVQYLSRVRYLPSPRTAGRRWREAPDEGALRDAQKHCGRPLPTTRPLIGRSPHGPFHWVLPWRTACFGVVSGAGVNQPDPIFVGQRRSGRRSVTPATRRPSRCGARPRRVVSTSGGSGMGCWSILSQKNSFKEHRLPGPGDEFPACSRNPDTLDQYLNRCCLKEQRHHLLCFLISDESLSEFYDFYAVD